MPRGPRSPVGRLRSTLAFSGRLLLPLLLTAAGAGPVLAQAISVRAGEHDGFTRLVLPVPPDDAWTLVPGPGGFELRGPAGATFDTGEVFGRIPRDRIAGLDRDGAGRLGIIIACDCHADTFWEPDVGLVVDVIDGPAPRGAVVPGPVPPSQPVVPPLSLAAVGPSAVLLPGTWDDTLDTPPREAARVARTEAAILDSVAEAARRGLLDLAPGARLREEPSGPVDLRPEEDSPEGKAQPGLAVRTGAEVTGPAPDALGATGTACLSEDELDLSAWAGSGTFEAEIPPRMAALTDARDRLDPDAAEALARAYLAFGFGREAAVALDLDGRSSRGRDVLRALARLIDGESLAPGTFGDQAGCLGAVALWRALARGTVRGTDDRERTAIALALRALPTGARDAVALRVAGLFLEAGDAAAAEAMMAAQGGVVGGDALLARVEIARDAEGPIVALAELEDAAENNARLTPEAMAELLDLLVEEGRPVGEDTLELARALRFEHGGSRVLLLAEARALSAGGRFVEALGLLDDERTREPGQDLEEALATTADALTGGLEDGPFLEFALGGLPDRLPPEAREAVARRLSDLGFREEARKLTASADPSGLGTAVAALPALVGEAGTPHPAVVAPAGRTREHGLPPVLSSVNASGVPNPSASTAAADEAAVATAGIVIPPPPPLAAPAELAPVAAPAQPAGTSSAVEPASSIPDVSRPEPPIALSPALATMPRDVGPASADAPSQPASAESPPIPVAPAMTLAERRVLLDQAEEARARAAALLDQGLPN